MIEKIEVNIDEVKNKIKEFYKPDLWHFVCLNANDIEGTCKLQWIFSKYEEKENFTVFECDVAFDTTVPTITDIIPSAIMSEMEIVDLFGLKIQTIKKGLYLDETSQQTPLKEKMATKKTINIPLGSQHISLLEPIRFNFSTQNEKIVDVDWDVGFVHRGIEKACTTNFEFKQVGYVVARVCGLCAITHSLSYTIGVEKLLDHEVNRKIKYLRLLMLELDRIHSHMLCLAHVSENAGFEGMFMKIMADRELVMDIQEAISGNRVQFDYVSIGGVNRDLDLETEKLLKKNISLLEEKIDDLIDKFTNNWSLSLKYKNIGHLSKEDAYNMNALGPMARACGAKIDVRLETSDFPYDEVGYELVLEQGGDIHSRNMVRLREIKNSIKMVRNIVDGVPEGEILEKVKGKPKGETFMRIEAPRGEIFYYLNATGKSMLQRVRIKTPTFSQIPAMVNVFKGANYADAHAILASFDPCMSCTAK